VGANDFASMKEIVKRRYQRLIKENKSLPQLIVIDGGKGQLSSAVEALEELNLRGKIAIIGIAKKLEEIYFPNDSIPLLLNKNSETLKIIQQIRNESHRFGINFHRKLREKQMIKSELDQINGIGPKTKEKLLKHFKSVEKIKKAELQEISQITGKAKAKIIFDFFNLK
jgi:excinuclease ABC subunit C